MNPPGLEIDAALLLLGAALPLSVAFTNIALGIATLGVAAALAGKRIAWNRSWDSILIPAAVYAAVGLLAAAVSEDRARALHDALKDWHKVWTLGVLLLALSIRPKARLDRAFAAGFTAAALFGIWQSGTQHIGFQMMRAHARVHPVTYGEIMALGLLGAMSFWGRREAVLDSTNAKLALGAFMTATGLAVVLSQTRGAVLGVVAGFLAICWLDKAFRRWILRGAGALVCAAFAWELMPTGGRSLSGMLSSGNSFNPLSERAEMWRAAWGMFRDHPILGVGPGNYYDYFPRYAPGRIEGQVHWGSTHNLFLHVLAERGLVGELALLAFLGALTVRAYRRARLRPSAWSLWAWGTMAAFLVMNLTEVAFQNELFATLTLAVWAWAEARADIAPGQKFYN